MADTIKKITKKERFSQIREIVKDNPELVAFIDHEIELLDKKNSNSGQTKIQQENIALMDVIVAELVKVGKPVTITELQKSSEVMARYSNQKLSALLKKLSDEGDNKRVTKVTDKKKTYFSANTFVA